MNVGYATLWGLATWMWDDRAMPETEDAVSRLRAAVRRYERATQAAARSRDDLANVIAEALRAGVKPRAVAEVTGYTAEHIRRIARAHHVPRLREPTVTSRRKQRES